MTYAGSMNIDSLKDTYQSWTLYRYIDSDVLAELSGGTSSQVHAERIYAYARYYSKGRITVNAWYYPTFDPYGEYPYEIQFFFAARDGEILKEVSIFEPDVDAQLRTIHESLDNIEAFFWKRLSMKLTDIIPLLGDKTESKQTGVVEPLPAISGDMNDADARTTGSSEAVPSGEPPAPLAPPHATPAMAANETAERKQRIRKFLGSR